MRFRLPLLCVILISPLWPQYSGPAILSRGEAPAAMAAPQVDFRPYVEASEIYSTGMATVAVDANGHLASSDSYGESLIWGISGVHSWRHTRVGLDYRGGVYFYDNRSGYDSLDEELLLGITHQISRHAVFTLHQGAGVTSRVFGPEGLRQTVPFDPTTTYIPVTDYFNNRTVYVTTQAGLTIQKTARLSFNLGGDLYLTRYRSHALYGTTGLSANGDVQYRLNRKSTVGAQYVFDHFFYPGIWGSADAHGAAGSYSLRMNRYLEFSGYAGFMRIESSFIQTVPVDPAIAALLGISGAPQIVHTIHYTPHLAGRFSRTFRNGVVYVSAGHSVNPGNGLFLASTMTQTLAGYTYTGLRRWSFGATAGYERANALVLINGLYSDTSESVTLSRQWLRSLHFILSFTARQFDSPQYPNYSRNITEARTGIGYSPGDIPLRVW